MIRDAIPKPEALNEINQYLAKARSVTPFDLANRFGIRMSVARKILREREADGSVVPYIRESGFVVYTTPAEIAKREGGAPIMTADVFEEISASVSHESVIDDEMEAALAAAASSAGTVVKPSKLAYRRREAGERRERKEARPEIVVEPLVKEETPPPSQPKKVEDKPKPAEDRPKKEPKKAEEKLKKEPRKESKKAEEKPKKVEDKPKKVEDKPKKVEEKPKKEPKKETTKAEAKPKETTKVKKPELEDIDGIGPKTAETLRASGFKTVASLSKTTVEKLSKKVDGIAEATATQYIESAKKLISEYENSK